MKYQVYVSGVLFDETDDFLIAHATAGCYKRIGWKNVEVREAL